MQHHARVQYRSRKRASSDERDLCSSKYSTTQLVMLYDDVELELSGRNPGTIDYPLETTRCCAPSGRGVVVERYLRKCGTLSALSIAASSLSCESAGGSNVKKMQRALRARRRCHVLRVGRQTF